MVCLRRARAGWMLVSILTFTSFVMLGQKGDRPTEQSSSFIRNDWRNRQRVALSLCSQTENGENPLVSLMNF